MGRAGCPSREPDCLKPAGTEEGVSACMHVANLLGDRAKPMGTEEGASTGKYVMNSLGRQGQVGLRK
jgi:hypothetical protein